VVEQAEALTAPRLDKARECATLLAMHTTRAYFFGGFWFSRPGGREI